MKMIVMALGFLVSAAAFGNGLAEMDKTERCAAWVTNAMHGAESAYQLFRQSASLKFSTR